MILSDLDYSEAVNENSAILGGVSWVPVSGGNDIPSDAIPGGYEPGGTLYICRTGYAGGVHPGKVVNRNCNISYGAGNIESASYEVLVY